MAWLSRVVLSTLTASVPSIPLASQSMRITLREVVAFPSPLGSDRSNPVFNFFQPSTMKDLRALRCAVRRGTKQSLTLYPIERSIGVPYIRRDAFARLESP
jgi:hypothetical protein